jgi:WD40 repeat protein
MRLLLPLGLLLLVPALVHAEEKNAKPSPQPIQVIALNRKEPVAYEKDIEPILNSKCQVCHSGSVKEGKLDMGSYESLMKGGKRGRPIVPGKSADSLLVRLAGKTRKPFMPPKTEEPLTPEELALIKLWIDQGAKAPGGRRERPKIVLASLPPSVHPVRALAISPDRSALAAGRGNQIHIYDAGSGTYIRSLVSGGGVSGESSQPITTHQSPLTPHHPPINAAHLSIVESLAYSPDGRFLASGSFREVVIWDAQTGLLRTRLTGFVDRVVALAFSPNGKLLATGGGAPSEDGEIKLFDVASGKLVADIKNGHSDQVFGVSFSPDGKKLATCGADKFVKVFEVPGGKLLKAFEGHTHHVLDVA